MKKIALISGLVGLAIGFAQENLKAQVLAAAPLNQSIHIAGQCQFQITDMFGGSFDVPQEPGDSGLRQGMYYFPATGPEAPHVLGSFSLDCRSSQNADIDTALEARQINGEWMKYDPLPGRSDFIPFDKEAHPQTVTLQGKNWTGTGLTVDATIGDEQQRTRIFRFCLIHETQALCGDIPVARLTDPKDSELWKAKAILQSIEFFDEQPSTNTNPNGSVVDRSP